MKKLHSKFVSLADKLRDLPLLALRIVLAIGFFEPGLKKLGSIEGTAVWYESMGIPAPTLNAYLSGGIETVGAVLILLGLGTRVMSIPMIFTMIVAWLTVHLGKGYNVSDGGYELVLYYIIMLVVLLTFGAGRISIDQLLKKKS